MKAATQQPKIVRVFNKKTGVTYLYENHPYWDKEAKQGRSRRKCIGRLDDGGNPVYNDYYLHREASLAEGGDGMIPPITRTVLIGQNLVLDKVIGDLGLKGVLAKAVGAEDAELALQLVRHSVCTVGMPMYLAPHWLDERGYDGTALGSQRITELLRRLGPDKRNTFFRLWIERHSEERGVFFDVSSISSHAKAISWVERGYNRDGEKLPQVNVGLLSSVKKNTPLWFTELAGSINDTQTLRDVLEHMDKLGGVRNTITGDRAFYSRENITLLTERKYKFLMPVPSNIKWARELIEKHRGHIRRPDTLITSEDGESIIYALKTSTVGEFGRVWFHIYFDATRKERSIATLMGRLNECRAELLAGKPTARNKSYYERYFEVRRTPKRGLRVTLKEGAVDEYINNQSGFWILYTNAEKDPVEALRLYRRRNDVELLFDDLKNASDSRRLRVHSDAVMQGRLFISFLALVVLTRLKDMVKAIPAKERNHWNWKEILIKVNTYSKTRYKGRYKDVYSCPTKAQRKIFDLLGVKYHYKDKVVNEDETVDVDEGEAT